MYVTRQPTTAAEALATLRRAVKAKQLTLDDMATLHRVYLDLAREVANFAAQYPTLAEELPVVPDLAQAYVALARQFAGSDRT